MEAMAYTLARCRDWKVFATLTWKGASVPSPVTQRKMLFAHLYRVAKLQKIPFRRLLWAVRQEKGEKTGRQHYHVLIGWRGPKATIGHCFTLNSNWTKLPKCGWARHFVYNPGQDAVGYITKGLSGCFGGNRLDESNYEAGKFGWDSSEVTLSEAFVRLVSRSTNRRLNGETLTGRCGKSEERKIGDKNQP